MKCQCVHGDDGSVRLEYTQTTTTTTTTTTTQVVTTCKYNGKEYHEGEKFENNGATFKCTNNGKQCQFAWESGGECKTKENTAMQMNEAKRNGNVTHKCV